MEVLKNHLVGLEGLEDIVKELDILKNKFKLWLFNGDLGSGKTTLIKHLLKKWGSNDVVKSPTFNIVHEYDSIEGVIYHFDLYRIERFEELLEFGMDEYLFSGNICLIEWPEMAHKLIETPFLEINIAHTDDHLRTYQIVTHE